jgi:hypothetical protein
MTKLDLAPGQTWHTDAGRIVTIIGERRTKNQWLVCMANNRHCEFTVYQTGRFIRGGAEVQNLTERATRVYIAGPITGMPNDNHPAFHAAAADYRSRGCFVINPAEVFAPGTAPGWVECMRVLLPLLMTCEMIVMLPGWTKSKGARLEHHTARELAFAIAHPANEIHPAI